MKIYISGSTIGSEDLVAERFRLAQRELSLRGYEAVIPFPWDSLNLRSGLRPSFDSTINILLLLGCQSVYMLSGWENSVMSSIEQTIALLTCKSIMYQSRMRFSTLKRSIPEIMGVTFSQITGRDRKRVYVYARMIYANYCYREGITVGEIAEEINRNHSTIGYYLRKYDDDVKYNSVFRRIVESFESYKRKFELGEEDNQELNLTTKTV
ncbi:MAG: DUF4406 domain-containing protein [Prevotellaceae bacterium]|jgi:hypothetical protein|nr:DUF4406 domain-containing protein [Prevotellaceae bacterium]